MSAFIPHKFTDEQKKFIKEELDNYRSIIDDESFPDDTRDEFRDKYNMLIRTIYFVCHNKIIEDQCVKVPK